MNQSRLLTLLCVALVVGGVLSYGAVLWLRPPQNGEVSTGRTYSRLEMPLIAENEASSGRDTRALALAVEDLDGDGLPELITAGDHFSRSTYGFEGAISIWQYDIGAGSVRPVSEAHWKKTGTPQVGTVHTADVDGDGRKEIVTFGYERRGVPIDYFAHIGVWTYLDRQISMRASEEWYTSGDTEVTAASVWDLDSDGKYEIITGQTVRTPQWVGSSLRIWRVGLDGLELVWTSETTGFVRSPMSAMVPVPSSGGALRLITAHQWGFMPWTYDPGSLSFIRDQTPLEIGDANYSAGPLARVDSRCSTFVSFGTLYVVPSTQFLWVWNLSDNGKIVQVGADGEANSRGLNISTSAVSHRSAGDPRVYLFEGGYEEYGNETLAYVRFHAINECRPGRIAENEWVSGDNSRVHGVVAWDFNGDGGPEVVSAGFDCSRGCRTTLRIWSIQTAG